jgi:hypothetical protein
VTTLDLPQAGGTIEQTTDVGDYRVVDGVKTAFSVMVTSTAQTIVITLTTVELNTPIDDAIFSRPGVK